MKTRHKGRFAYLDSTFRLLKSRNKNVFSAEDVCDTYNVIAPKMQHMSTHEVAGFLRLYHGSFGIRKHHQDIRESADKTGTYEAVTWTWR